MTDKPSADLPGQVIALAGIIQAAAVVDCISKTGEYRQDQLMPLIDGLFEFNPQSSTDVFGGAAGVKKGLEQLLDILDAQSGFSHRDIIRYFFGMLYLGRAVSKNRDMLAVIGSRLEHTALKKQHFANHINDICQSLSGIYQDTLSGLNYRIQVTGSLIHLQNEKNSDLIRAALFSGIRSAILWRQCGGRRWKMVFQRRKISEAAKALLQSIRESCN